LGEVEIIELNLSLDQYWIFLTPEGRKVSRPRHPRIVGPPKPSISSTVEIEASAGLCHGPVEPSIADIVWLLGEDNGTVVRALLEEGIIQDRRRQSRLAPQEDERRKSIANLRTTELYARLRT